jgi:hypothetical protein
VRRVLEDRKKQGIDIDSQGQLHHPV